MQYHCVNYLLPAFTCPAWFILWKDSVRHDLFLLAKFSKNEGSINYRNIRYHISFRCYSRNKFCSGVCGNENGFACCSVVSGKLMANLMATPKRTFRNKWFDKSLWRDRIRLILKKMLSWSLIYFLSHKNANYSTVVMVN